MVLSVSGNALILAIFGMSTFATPAAGREYLEPADRSSANAWCLTDIRRRRIDSLERHEPILYRADGNGRVDVPRQLSTKRCIDERCFENFCFERSDDGDTSQDEDHADREYQSGGRPLVYDPLCAAQYVTQWQLSLH